MRTAKPTTSPGPFRPHSGINKRIQAEILESLVCFRNPLALSLSTVISFSSGPMGNGSPSNSTPEMLQFPLLHPPFYPGAEMLWQPMRRMRNIKIIEWAMTNNKNESENENGNENVSFFLPLQLPLSFVSLSLPFCHHKAFSDLAWHILSLLLMLKMANKNVYDARTPTETQVNSRKMCSKKR